MVKPSDFLLRDMVGWYLALGLFAALAALFPWELGQKANPFGWAPEGIKPEWYFLFMFQLRKILPARIGPFEGEVLVVIVLPLLIPFTQPKTGARQVVYGSLAVATIVLLAATGWEVLG